MKYSFLFKNTTKVSNVFLFLNTNLMYFRLSQIHIKLKILSH